MLYYRVPANMDGKTLYKKIEPPKGAHTMYKPLFPSGYYLIGGELLTPAECRKLNAPTHLLEAVNVKKTEVYNSFGARFPVSGANVTTMEV